MSIKVLVVDDSALIRKVLVKSLQADSDIEVVGTAKDPIEARERIKILNPDVLTLDIEMPNMNGLAFLDRLMKLRPMPVVMVSTLTQRGAEETLLALELGAVDFAAKPNAELAGVDLDSFGAQIRNKVRAAAKSAVASRALGGARAPAGVTNRPLVTAAAPEGTLFAIGASTGGVEAVRAVLSELPTDCPPVVITQHMPAGFTTRFAERLNDQVRLSVHEAADKDELKPGHAYIAPGDFHMMVERRAGILKTRIVQSDPVSGHRPSVDVLFGSVADAVGPMAIGAILTGMGRDGATGLKRMRDAGAHTIGQSAASSLVYGMPRVAFEEGAVVEQCALEQVATHMVNALQRKSRAA